MPMPLMKGDDAHPPIDPSRMASGIGVVLAVLTSLSVGLWLRFDFCFCLCVCVDNNKSIDRRRRR